MLWMSRVRGAEPDGVYLYKAHDPFGVSQGVLMELVRRDITVLAAS
jgi:hypothetical protein